MHELTRAVAEGRLALAEVAAISGEELDAIYETAVMRLDTGRNAEGARMLAALVVLYPFATEYWRAYGVALERLGEVVAARRAYAMARKLEPSMSETLVRELLGEHGATEPTNPSINSAATEITTTDAEAPGEPTQTSVTPSPENTEPHINATRSMTEDTTRTAPPSRTPLRPMRAEPTLTIRPAPPPKEPTVLITWPLPADPAPLVAGIDPNMNVQVAPRLSIGERSITAIVDRRPRPMEAGETGRIERRLRRRVTANPLPVDDSLTAIVRRRNGLPLGEDV